MTILEIKYSEDAIHLKDEILKSLNNQFDQKAEELVIEQKTKKITKEIMNRAILLVLLEKGFQVIYETNRKFEVEKR